ncbi:phagocyte signaling-impaired protein [Dorcoceras hygrometricum]|uniref:Phagocyte signaling-impaired protein n=1 Tax=Dorcoceras hygrometricum TaxID=472368 RepID=A0A2Z7AWJ4_9LAMI|nr:phagocyte signaling-impaired protein [Dorcoceras hygrometricum]
MASKFGLAGGIPERRVRPIWDAIDSRQFKNALKQSTSLLSKYPNSPYALALKALILERMGKNEEALSICLNAKEILLTKDSSNVIDDLTLSTLQIVFQRLDHLDMATSCYEFACSKYPNNLELMMGLFNCYIAIKMYKIAGEERFLMWAVCSIQLQVCCSDGGEKLFHLAEGLLKKHIASHSLHEPEALSVYITLLEQQSKYGNALEVLNGPLGSLMMIEVDKLRLQGKLLAMVRDYGPAAECFQKVLELCPDDWECFLQYLGCLLEDESMFTNTTDPHPVSLAECNSFHVEAEVFDARISSAVNFVQKLIAIGNNNSLRCPYLANLEIERRKILCGKEKNVILKKLEKELEFSGSVSTKALGQSINVLKIQNLIGDMFTLPVNEVEDLAVRMTQMFCQSLPLSKELDVQDSMYGEELLSMACDVLVQLFWRTRNLGYLLESILILEFGLTIRRYIWQYKLLLVHLYSHWNTLPLAYERYKSLDVKNILLETISHHILPQMLASPMWADLNDLLSEYVKFMDDHFRESADLTFLAYRHRNYSKVIEFVQFKERLQCSNQYLMAKIEAPILQLKQNSNNIDEVESILESSKFGTHFLELSNEIRSKPLIFNEDLKLRPWWTPTYDKNYLLEAFEGASYCPRANLYNQIKQTEENILKLIEKRSILPRMVYLSIHSASASVKKNVGANGSVDPKLSVELKVLLERHAKILEFPFMDAVELVSGVSSRQKFFEEPNSDIIDWMNFCIFLNAWNLDSHELMLTDRSDPGSDGWRIVNSLLGKSIKEKIKSAGEVVSSPGDTLPFLVRLITEPLSWHGLIIQSCVRSLVPTGKKKKKGGATEQSNSQISYVLQDSIQSLCDTIQIVLNWLKEQLEKPEDENFEAIFSTIRKQNNNGPGKVFQVLESSLSLMKDVDLGDRILESLNSWNPADVPRKIISGQRGLLSEFLRICELKIKSLQELSVHL